MWQTYLNYHQRIGILPLKKRVNRNKCSFSTKLRMFVVFAIDEILCYRWAPLAGSRTLCHPGHQTYDGRGGALAKGCGKIFYLAWSPTLSLTSLIAATASWNRFITCQVMFLWSCILPQQQSSHSKGSSLLSLRNPCAKKLSSNHFQALVSENFHFHTSQSGGRVHV